MGPRPQGNPGAMMAAAGRMPAIAGHLSAFAGRTGQVLPGPAFIGPGRTQHDAAFEDAYGDAMRAANALNDEAAQLGKDAADIHRRQVAWDHAKKAQDDREKQAREDAQRAAGR